MRGSADRLWDQGEGLPVIDCSATATPCHGCTVWPRYPMLHGVPVLQELLKLAEAAAPEGDYGQLKSITARILGSPNNLQENLRSAAACTLLLGWCKGVLDWMYGVQTRQQLWQPPRRAQAVNTSMVPLGVERALHGCTARG